MAKTNDTPKKLAAVSVKPVNTEGKEVSIIEAVRLVFKAANGSELIADPGVIPESLLPTLILHGLKQKLIDAAAISRDPETGRSATVADKWAAVEAVYDRLMQGEWFAARGDGTGSGGLLFKALCRMFPAKTADQVREWLANLSDKDQAALRTNPKVAAIIETIRAEMAKATDVDSDELLNQLENSEDEADEAA